MKHAQLPFDARIVAGEAIQMGDDGIARKRSIPALAGGEIFQAVEPVEAKMLDGNVIHEHFFMIGDGLVFAVQGLAKTLEGVALAVRKVREEKLVGGAQSVFESVHARAVFAVGSFGHDVEYPAVRS